MRNFVKLLLLGSIDPHSKSYNLQCIFRKTYKILGYNIGFDLKCSSAIYYLNYFLCNLTWKHSFTVKVQYTYYWVTLTKNMRGFRQNYSVPTNNHKNCTYVICKIMRIKKCNFSTLGWNTSLNVKTVQIKKLCSNFSQTLQKSLSDTVYVP